LKKVSVVVPVFNPGAYIEDCVASLLRQSMPAGDFEIILVDDGSTDGTSARLDELSAAHPNITVIHQENSGWSGKPRNVGLDVASGDYVMFVDNDDWIGDEALERMYAYGLENDADIVIGKMAGKGRPVPLELFRENRPRATLENAPLIDSLTPHKMFRRSFLNRHVIRFPVGRRRLEDHVFVAEAYCLATTVSVLSDYVCYIHIRRDDGTNAGYRALEPASYFSNLGEALDIVARHIPPGPLRDGMFRRWLRNEMIERLRGRRFLALPEEHREELFDAIRKVTIERFGPGVAAGLPPLYQLVAAHIVAGRLDGIAALAEWEAGITAYAGLEHLRWESGRLLIGFTGRFLLNGAPLTDLPVESPPQATADVVVRERNTSAEFFVPIEQTGEQLITRGTAVVDPLTAAATGPLEAGIWDVLLRISAHGLTRTVRIGSSRTAEAEAGRTAALIGNPPRLVLPYWTDPHGNLSLDIGQSTNRIAGELKAIPADAAQVVDGSLHVRMPIRVTDDIAVRVRFAAPDFRTRSDGLISAADDGALLRVALPNLPSGWHVGIRLPGSNRFRRLTATAWPSHTAKPGRPLIKRILNRLSRRK
jgi:glycosyltransferase involved in cell wall biosynthesis